MKSSRGDWPAQIEEARAVSVSAVELSVRSEKLLGSLRNYLASGPDLPFHYLSIHGPSKHRKLPEEQLAADLCQLAKRADAIVMHPDTLERPERFSALGQQLLLENMDAGKDWGRTWDELAPVFSELPEAGFCLDVAHAWSIDPDMSVAEELLAHFRHRLRQVHISSLSRDLHHVPLTEADEELFRPVLERCADVPWILEAPIRSAGG
jgi:hypothetical protein